MLINSHMDTLVVNAMHQYNVAASRMGLPSRTKAVEKLADDLSKCSDNVKVFPAYPNVDQWVPQFVPSACSGMYCLGA